MSLTFAQSRPSWVDRLRRRFRHGLLLQEIFDRLDERNVACLAYYVTVEERQPWPDLALPPGCHVRELGPEDAASVAAVSVRKRTEESVRDLFGTMRGFGIFVGDALAGYTWVRFSTVPVPNARIALFELSEREAYLTDMYVAPAHRGARLAPLLRSQVICAMHEEGRTTCYSLSLAFNRSSRQFKSRLGAQERELRLYLHLRFGPLRGIDLRLWRRGPRLRTRSVLTTPSPREVAARG